VSDKYTEVSAGGTGGGLGMWGHIPYAEAVGQLRKHYERELATAQAVLAAIDDGNVQVFHQLGPWARKNRREVQKSSEGPDTVTETVTPTTPGGDHD